MNAAPKTLRDSPPELLTPRDVMRILRIGRTALHQRIKSGALPVIRLGRLVRIEPAALAALIRASATTPDSSLGTKLEGPTCPSLPDGVSVSAPPTKPTRTEANQDEQS